MFTQIYEILSIVWSIFFYWIIFSAIKNSMNHNWKLNVSISAIWKKTITDATCRFIIWISYNKYLKKYICEQPTGSVCILNRSKIRMDMDVDGYIAMGDREIKRINFVLFFSASNKYSVLQQMVFGANFWLILMLLLFEYFYFQYWRFEMIFEHDKCGINIILYFQIMVALS